MRSSWDSDGSTKENMKAWNPKWTAGWIVVDSSRLLRSFYLSFLTCWTVLTEIWNTSPADMWPRNLYTQRNIEIFLCVFLIGTKDGGIDQFLMLCKRGGSQSYVPFYCIHIQTVFTKWKTEGFSICLIMISAIYLIRSTDVYYTCWCSVKYMHSNKTQITHENLFISQTKSQAFIMSESKSSLRSIIVRLQVINTAE